MTVRTWWGGVGAMAQDQPFMLGDFFDGTGDGGGCVNIKVGKKNASRLLFLNIEVVF